MQNQTHSDISDTYCLYYKFKFRTMCIKQTDNDWQTKRNVEKTVAE